MRIDEIRELFAYDSWANDRVFDALEELSDSELRQDLSSSLGSLFETFYQNVVVVFGGGDIVVLAAVVLYSILHTLHSTCYTLCKVLCTTYNRHVDTCHYFSYHIYMLC